MKITAVTCVKNEGPFLLEWIAFNRVIGVTDHLIYSNDCDDHTDDLLDALAAADACVHLPNPAQGRNYQMEALKHAAKHPLVTGAEWIWIADVDEFLNIHCGNGTLPELIVACGSPHAISVHFQFFANSGIGAFEDVPVTQQFTQTHNPNLWCGARAIEVKSLVRRDFPLQYFGAHRPFFKGPPPESLRWCDGSGRAVPHKFLVAANKNHIRKFPSVGARRHATLNHYALRSLDSYLVKNDRGDVNRENRVFDDSYWRERNDTSWEETSILRYRPRLEREMAALRALPKVDLWHRKAVAAHRAKLSALMAQPFYVALRQQLRSAPPFCATEEALLSSLGPPVLEIGP